MKILFIRITIGTWKYGYHSGIASISAILKKHHHKTNYFNIDSWNSLKALDYKIETFKPDMIGFGSFDSTFNHMIKVSKIITKKYPHIFLFYGGINATLNPKDFIKAKNFNAICIGEGEYSTLELVNKYKNKDRSFYKINGFWFRKNGKIIKNPLRKIIENLNELPYPDMVIFSRENALYSEIMGVKRNAIPFLFSRGCPYQCTYCSNHALSEFYGKKYVRFKSPARAICEIQEALKNYRADFLTFDDDTLTIDKKWTLDFLKMYQKEIRLPFKCNTRVDCCDEEIISKLKEAGCEILVIGIESGNLEIREKVMNRFTSNELIKEFISLTKKYQLTTLSHLLIGLPNETPKKFLDTLKLEVELQLDYHSLSIFHPYKGTVLYDICHKNKYFSKSPPKNFKERADTILELPDFPRKDILYIYENYDLFVNILHKTNNLFLNLHKRFLFYLLYTPPSSPGFKIKRIIFYLYRLPINFFINLKNLFFESFFHSEDNQIRF